MQTTAPLFETEDKVIARPRRQVAHPVIAATEEDLAGVAGVALWGEVCIEDAKQIGGVGQARNRVRLAVERTVPFAFLVNTLAVLWYATAGYHPGDVDERRELAPWYRDKAQPSVLDMVTKLRRVVIAGYLRPVDPQPPTCQEIAILRLAWEDVAA